MQNEQMADTNYLKNFKIFLIVGAG